MIKPWKLLDSEILLQAGFFKLRKDKCELPDGRIMPSYYVTEFQDWVHMVAITKTKKMVMVKQYRHAGGEVFLEVPGGSSSPKDNKDFKGCGLRELREETGFDSARIDHVATLFPNPGIQTNRLHVFIAWDCEKKFDQDLDPFEDLEVLEMEISDVYKLCDQGKITQALALASLSVVRPLLKV